MTPDTTLAHAIARRAEAGPEAVALAFLAPGRPPEHVSFGRLHADACAVAARLRREGIAPGDLVVLAGEHDYPSVVALVAAFYAGAVPSVFPYVSSYHDGPIYRQRLVDIVRGFRVRAVLAAPGFPPGVAEALAAGGCKVLAVEAPQTAGREAFSPYEADAASPAYVQFSSGTTGEPKGAVISHRAALHQIDACVGAFELDEADLLAGWLPLYHDLGLAMQLLLSLVTGRPLVTIAPQQWVRQPLLLLQAAGDYRATWLLMPNFGYAHLARTARDRDLAGLDLGSLRRLVTGGELVQASTLERFAARFAGCGLRPNLFGPGYGLAECTSGVTVTRPGRRYRLDHVSRRILLAEGFAAPVAATDPDAAPVTGCGVPFPGVTVTVVDDAGTPLPDRRVGEIVIEAPFLFDGYLHRPDLTAEVLREGRVYTGDLGYRVGDELFVVDRKKDLIISGGANLYPDSIERVAKEAVGDPSARAAAFGVRDDEAGTELPVVVCEVRGQMDAARQAELAQRVRQAARQVLDVPLADVAFVPRGWIVKTTSGKIARRATRQKYLDARPQTPADSTAALARRLGDLSRSPASPERQAAQEEVLRLFCEKRLGHVPLGRQDDFFAVGCDSIRILQVLLEVEEATGRPVPVEYVLERPSLARLLEALDEPAQAASPEAARLPAVLSWRPGPGGDGASGAASPRGRRYRRLRASLLPFAVRRHLLCRAAGWAWVQERRFPEQAALVRRLLPHVGAGLDEAGVVRRSVVGNVLHGWLRRSQHTGDPWPVPRHVAGDGRLRDALRQGQPVVLLLSHTVCYDASYDVLLSDLPAEPILVGRLGPGRRSAADLEEAGGADEPQLRLFTYQLHAAVQHLGRGGVVVMAGDGYQGRAGLTLPFCDRRRRFGTGFAELAVRTGALVLPVFTRVDTGCCLHLEVQEALALPPGPHPEPADALIRQYVDRLAGWWSRYPDSVVWRHLGHFLRLPEEEPQPQ